MNNDPGFGPETSIGEIPDTQYMHNPLNRRVTLRGLCLWERILMFHGFICKYSMSAERVSFICASVSLQESLFTTKATLNIFYSSIYFRASSLEFYIFFVLLTDVAYAYRSCQISTQSSHEKCKFDFNV